MRQPIFTKQFKRDVKRLKRSNKNMALLKLVINKLVENETLDSTYHDHALHGNWKHCRKCHIQGDWLLIYKFVNNDKIYFERTGSHAELFE